ncbi:unnamed protein product [Paramecium pentaurelia]|uniref:Uncharacterized protein n=1 Tax=Paramecium pentaurelia TaxID=43138 RepID=A0A8S1SNT1_9CILI|nr:unnamed protein product [Paramecium pentaurelia]
MYSPDSSIDDRYFYNPMNSLSESEQDMTFQNKSSLISEQPAIAAKKTGTIIENSVQSLEKKTINFKVDNVDNYKEVKLPDQSFNKQYQQPTQNIQKPQPQVQQNIRVQKTNDQKPSAVGNSIVEQTNQSARKKPRIFEPLNTDEKLEQTSFLKELNRMAGEEAQKKHLEVKQIQNAEDLIIQKQLFLFTNFNEKNVQQYIDKAKDQVEKLEIQQDQLLLYKEYNQKLNEIGPLCLDKEVSLLDQTSEEKRKQKSREEFKLLYNQISKLEIASRTDYDQDCSEMIQTMLKEIEIKLKLEFAIENLQRLKPQLQILKNNRNFQTEFQAYLDLIKQSQKYESEKLKPQLELMKSSLKIRAQKIYQQIN